MTPDQIEHRVREILAKKFSLAPEKITLESRIIEDLGVDSFGALELLFEVEEAFGLKIPDADAGQVKTVRDIVVYVEGWLQKESAPPAATENQPDSRAGG